MKRTTKSRAANRTWTSGELPTTPSGLADTPKRLLEAARRVFEREGYAGLRLEAIAEEAGLAHSLIRYHFGSKAGLVGVLIDWLLYETYISMHSGMTALSPDDTEGRVRTMTNGLRQLFRDMPSYRLYVELVGAALRDDDLRPKLAESFVGQRRLILEALEEQSRGGSQRRADALAAIVVAFSDGLAMQHLADPNAVDLEYIFAVWDEIMEHASRAPAGDDAPGS